MATAAPALVALVLGASGCMDYTIETTLEADGTGVRVERMEITRSDASNLSERDVRALTASSREKEWRTSHRVESDGDTTWVLERRSDVRTLRDWSDPARRTLILGTVPAKAEDRLGYVRLGDVAFRSSIQVGVSRRSDGTSLVSYRESFLWDQAVDAIVEFLVQDLDRALSERYPRLSAGERGSVVGFARARIWVAGEEGLFFGENEAEAVARAAEGTAEQAVKIVRVRYPEASVDELRTLVVERLDMEDEQLGRLFEQTLPGLNLGFNTTVVFRLTLPGAVGATNASSRDGNVLEWQFNPLDNLMAPLEVFAESVVGG
jgi:hypothetical protein